MIQELEMTSNLLGGIKIRSHRGKDQQNNPYTLILVSQEYHTRLIKQHRFLLFKLTSFAFYEEMKDEMMEFLDMFLMTMMITIGSLHAKLILMGIFSIYSRVLHGTDNKLSIRLHTPL